METSGSGERIVVVVEKVVRGVIIEVKVRQAVVGGVGKTRRRS